MPGFGLKRIVAGSRKHKLKNFANLRLVIHGNIFKLQFYSLLKKLLVILMVMVYGLSATGATLHIHFCCGKLDRVSFSTEHKKDCPKKVKSITKCCSSKQLELKVKADQEPAAKWLALQQVQIAIPQVTMQWVMPLAGMQVLLPFANGPPIGSASVPLFIQYCVFRI